MRVRQLVGHPVEQLLAHEVGHPERLGHVGDHPVGVVPGALGQHVDEGVDQCRHSVAGGRRQREVLDRHRVPARLGVEGADHRGHRGQVAEHAVAPHPVDLVHHHEQRGPAHGPGSARPQLGGECRGPGHGPHPTHRVLEHHPVAGADGAGGLDQGHHRVDVVERGGGRLVHPLPECRLGPVQAGGVDEDDLGVGPVEHATHLGPGGVGAGRRDRHLRPHHGVDQGRLAHVRPAHHGHEARAEGAHRPSAPASADASAGGRTQRRSTPARCVGR